jgi:uncharacterized membrane protein YqjE
LFRGTHIREEESMKVLRRLFGALVLLFATIGIVACVAAIVGIWILQQNVAQKVEIAYGRLDTGLKRLADANQKVKGALEKARADVERYNREAGRAGADNPNRTVLRRQLFLQTVGPRVNESGGRLDTFADAAIVVASLLQSLQELPLAESSRINPEDLNRASGQATDLSAAILKLQTAVNNDNPAADREIADATNKVDQMLQQCETTVAGWQTDLDNAQSELASFKARLLAWLLLGALAVTVIAAWSALGQVSLFAHGWKWCFGA